ncbi:MAG TPA: hypothetical protein VF175_18810 [Lacipirellula sp.]
MRIPSILFLSSALLTAMSPAAGAIAAQAFPGAVGQGAAATGGRGGDVYVVTNLDDYNPDKDEEKIPGSFRHALRSATGPRTIVFNVSGAIALRAPLEIRKSNLTIAGQTSPGGVTVWGYPTEIGGAKNAVIRYLRCRTGDFNARGSKAPGGNNDMDPSSANAINVGRCERVILDHVSASWGIDESLSVTKCRDVTVQNCLIAESLNESVHPKGPHGYGSLLRGELTPKDQRAGVGGYSLVRNVWAHHRARNPSIGGQQTLDEGQSESERRRSDVNLLNNIVYDWGEQATHRSRDGDVRINLVGNLYICGPAKKAAYFFNEREPARTIVYHRDNWQDLDQDNQHDGELVQTQEQIAAAFQNFGEGDELRSDGPPLPFYGKLAEAEIPAEDAYEHVLATAGASLWRDAIDRRVIDSIRNRTGRLINSQEEFRTADGKLPGIDGLETSKRADGFDADADGMADDFERSHGLNPADPGDRNGTTLSDQGYTNLEVYLNGLAE